MKKVGDFRTSISRCLKGFTHEDLYGTYSVIKVDINAKLVKLEKGRIEWCVSSYEKN